MFKIFNFLFKSSKKKSKQKIRTVYFGIRIRFLGLLFLVMLFIISFFSLMLYLNQRRTLFEEKKMNADKLIKILSVQAREYLDRDINTTRDEIKENYQSINDEANNYIRYNEFINKIMLVDKNYTILYSSFTPELYKKYAFSYFKKCLEQKREESNYDDNIKISKNERYMAITFPIILHKGDIIAITDDFNEFYDKYNKANKYNQAKYYRALKNKYKYLIPEEAVKPAKQSNKKKQTPAPAPLVSKENDIDFLFLQLFSTLIKDRKWNIKRGEGWLWEDKWLTDLKLKKIKTSDNEELKKINDLIIERMFYLHSQVDGMKKLGALAILYDYNKLTKDITKSIRNPVYAALGFLIFSIIVFSIIINVMIRNLKILEKWAIGVSEGDIDTKIYIETKDEIGRLSDVFNNMLNELKVKFHLEKFVSRSTKKMIDKKSGNDSIIETGVTDRKNLSFIFCDVRGFTSFTENNDPALVIDVLNMYFEIQARIIKSKKGDIDDYVGDQIMAHFSGENQADTALTTAALIMKEITKINIDRQRKELPFFNVGIGVHGGEVVVGNIGDSSFRMDFACLGDAVNLTSRLCSAASPKEILISKEIYKKSKKKVKVKKHEPISVKGKAEKIEVLNLLY